MKKINCIILLLAGIFFCGCICSPVKRDVVFQYSTINALLDGVYDGELTVKELKRKGDFGIGTFNRLDGEMVVLDGRFYQIRSDGSVIESPSQLRTPFVVLVFFKADQEIFLDRNMDLSELESCLNGFLPSHNFFTAIKIEGKFNYVETRSVPVQNKPYRPLVEIVKSQPTFEFRDIEGTLIGFRFPQYMKNLNVGGYHFHFISKDKTSGGHLLSCRLGEVRVYISQLSRYYLELPQVPDFLSLDLAQDRQVQLQQVER